MIKKPFLIFFIIVLVLYIVIDSKNINNDQLLQSPMTYLSMDKSYPCRFQEGWVEINQITKGDKLYICGEISSNTANREHYITYYIFKDKISNYHNAEKVDFIKISLDDFSIPINYNFPPGNYFIVGMFTRSELFSVAIEVKN